jgi:hypothetical protein
LERSLFHFGLVKIIGEAKLQNQNDSWKNFFLWNHFIEAPTKWEARDWNA